MVMVMAVVVARCGCGCVVVAVDEVFRVVLCMLRVFVRRPAPAPGFGFSRVVGP